MKASILYINEMLNTVNWEAMHRRLSSYIIGKYGGARKRGHSGSIELLEPDNPEYKGPVCFGYNLCGQIAAAVTASYDKPEEELRKDLSGVANAFGYNVSVSYWPRPKCYHVNLEPDKVKPIDLSHVTEYYNTYYRESFEKPKQVMRTGFRERGHFYAYHIGRFIAALYYVCGKKGLSYTDKEVHDYILDKIHDEQVNRDPDDLNIVLDTADDEDETLPYGMGFGPYKYEFRWDGQPYIDPMDGYDSLEEITEEDLDAMCEDLTGDDLDSITQELERNGLYWLLPVKIGEAVPPKRIRFLYNIYDEICDVLGRKGRYYGGDMPDPWEINGA